MGRGLEARGPNRSPPGAGAMRKVQVNVDNLILVDGCDRPVGTATKEQAHAQGLLHRAFSVVLVREGEAGPELLLARRAEGKYHSAGLWANSCCSHPRVGEDVQDAAYRRVSEELGCKAEDLRELGAFIYRAPFANGLVEYEYDHVVLGRPATGGEPAPDPAEVSAVRWVPAEELARELVESPEQFCAWAFTVLGMALARLGR